MLRRKAPKRRRPREDENVIRTEPDKRRATGNDVNDEFEAEERPVSIQRPIWSNITEMRYHRVLNRRSARRLDSSFPFLRLPPEIRNMIYRYIVISKSPQPIDLAQVKTFRTGAIETAILATSRQVHNEATVIMYDENQCIASYSSYSRGIALREDHPHSSRATSRSLRSGRNISMVQHSGLIYPHVARRLQNIEFSVNLFCRARFCDHMTVHFATQLHRSLECLFWFVEELIKVDAKEKSERTTKNALPNLGGGWTISVVSMGRTSSLAMKLALRPILQKTILALLKDGMIKMKLEGKFPQGWRKTFLPVLELPGFTNKVIEDNQSIIDAYVGAYATMVFTEEEFWLRNQW